RTLELGGIRSLGLAAAIAMWKRNHSVHVRWQHGPGKAGGDQLGGVSRAVAGCNYCDVITRAHAAIFAHISHERWDSCGNGRIRDLGGGEFVVQGQLFELEVLGMDMAARLDRSLGPSDHLPVAAYDLPRGDRR